MRTRTDKEQAEYLLNKIEMKERNGMDTTDELCEALEFIFEHSVDCDEEIDLEEHTKTFMKMHNTILPEDTAQRLEILIENVEHVLPKIKYGHPDFKESIKDMYITLDAISYAIYKYKEGTFYDIELPEDNFTDEINELYLAEDCPEERYYELTANYIVVLINKLKESIKNNDIEILKTVGIRIGFQSLQYERIYSYNLIKE